MGNVVAMFQDGGAFMWIILAVGVFASAICFDRVFYLYFRAGIDSAGFMERVKKFVTVNDIQRAIKECNAEPNAVLPRVIKGGLLQATEGDTDIQNAVEEATLEVAPLINKRIGYLGMLANVATLLGLLGTIQGLIVAFDAVARASAETKQLLLAQGISMAMYTTFMGLCVAIPIMVLQSFIQARANRILDDVDEYGTKLVNMLVARQRRSGQDAGGANG